LIESLRLSGLNKIVVANRAILLMVRFNRVEKGGWKVVVARELETDRDVCLVEVRPLCINFLLDLNVL